MVKIIAEFPINFHSNVLWTQLDKFYPDLHFGIPRRDSKVADYGPAAICQMMTCCYVSACHQDTAVAKTISYSKHLFKATALWTFR